MSARSVQVRSAPRTHKAPNRDLKVVRRKRSGLFRKRRTRVVSPALVIGVVLVITTISIVLMEQVMLAQTAFKVQQMRDRMVQAEARHAELVLQAARLGSSERIEQVATSELGMVHPDEVQYVVANVRTTGPKLARTSPRPLLPPSHAAAAFAEEAP